MQTLEKRITEILTETFGTEGTFTLRAHELTHDGEDWSSNDRFTFATDVSLDEALSAARNRWEVFKVNYNSKARVSDVSLTSHHEVWATIEADYLPFLDVEFTRRCEDCGSAEHVEGSEGCPVSYPELHSSGAV